MNADREENLHISILLLLNVTAHRKLEVFFKQGLAQTNQSAANKNTGFFEMIVRFAGYEILQSAFVDPHQLLEDIHACA